MPTSCPSLRRTVVSAAVVALAALAGLTVPRPAAAQNIALGRPTGLSSNPPGSLAVDGNTNGDYSAGSVFHTVFESNAWWYVDLGASYHISTVRIWNRTDCCADRLFPFQVALQSVFDAALNSGTVFGGIGAPNGNVGTNPILVDTHGATGRFVKVQLESPNYFHLAEVEVFGTPVVPTAAPEPATLALTATGLLALMAVILRRRARA